MYELTMPGLLFLSALCVRSAFLSTGQAFLVCPGKLSTALFVQITLRDLHKVTA
jgi:hypothetical protein